MTNLLLTADARRPSAKSRAARGGVVYIAVLGVAMIISIITLAALHIVRVELRATGGLDQMTMAQNAASSAVDLAMARIAADASWRTTYVSGREVPQNSWTTWGPKAKFKFVLTDDDGNLSDNDKDPVTVRGIGAAGDAIAATAVLAEPSGVALNCLEVALHAGDDVNISGIAAGTVTCDQFVSSNDDISVALFRTLDGDAWAVDNISGSGTVTGVKYESVGTAREMPDPAHVFKYYLANGTWIEIGAIPSRTIDRAIISANNNPYGGKNPQGIYIINCGSQVLKIKDSRINATLVILSTATPEIDDKINWEPPSPNYPALLVQGSLTMKWDGGSVLSESAKSTNFNPSGSPYVGVTDADVVDSYPGVIKGLVYVTGNLSITETCVLQGPVVVGGVATINNPAWISYDGSPFNFPPPGFSKGANMRMVPGTWRRTTRN